MRPFAPDGIMVCCGIAAVRRFIVLLLLHFATPAFALDPSLPPSRNFDLSHWYLTLPDARASMIKPSSLVGGYTNALWFFTGAVRAMTFYAPVNGGHTANSQNARSELREMIDPSD